LTLLTADAIITSFVAVNCVSRAQACAQFFAKSGDEQRRSLQNMDILRQLLELLIEALPTVFIVFFFYIFMRFVFFKPIERAMAERSERIDGAKAEAAAAQAAAREETERYNEAMRKARQEVYAEQEAARQAVLDERAKLLRALRTRTQEMVAEAKARIAKESEAARAEIEQQTPVLAGAITQMILERTAPSAGGSR